MKPWPEKPDYVTVPTWMDRGGNVVEEEPYFDETNYERARAEAAIARLRVAVEALRAVLADECTCHEAYKSRGLQAPDCVYCDQEEYREALDAVGEIPK